MGKMIDLLMYSKTNYTFQLNFHWQKLFYKENKKLK